MFDTTSSPRRRAEVSLTYLGKRNELFGTDLIVRRTNATSEIHYIGVRRRSWPRRGELTDASIHIRAYQHYPCKDDPSIIYSDFTNRPVRVSWHPQVERCTSSLTYILQIASEPLQECLAH